MAASKVEALIRSVGILKSLILSELSEIGESILEDITV